MQYIRVKEILPIIEAYKDAGKPFLLESTTFTKKLITLDKIYHYIPVSDMLNCEASLIRNVKMFADKIPDAQLPKVNRKKISYIKHGDYLNGLHTKELFEIDLNRAFWEFCFRESHISEKIYFQGLNIDWKTGKEIPIILNSRGEVTNHVRKKARLIALGNLAKRLNKLKYNGKFFARPVSTPARNENIFFNVAQLTDYTMKNLEMIAGEDFIFYWCDAVFFKTEKVKKRIEEFLTDQMEFNFKTVPIHSVNVSPDSVTVLDPTHLYTEYDFIEGNCKRSDIGKMKPRPFIFKTMESTDLSSIVEIKRDKPNLRFLKNSKHGSVSGKKLKW